MIPVRRALLVLAGLSVLGGLPGCKRGATPPADDPAAPPAVPAEPEPGGTLVVGYKADVDVLNPVVSTTDLGLQLTEVLFPTLARTSFDCALGFQPRLAERWSFDEAGTTLTLQLRDDARWIDGEAVDASDVAFTLERIRDPATGSAFQPYLAQLRAEQPLEVLDPHAVAIHYDHRYDPTTMLSHALGFPLIPEHVLADVPPDRMRGAPFSSDPVGGGPFRVERHVRDQELVLVRNDDPVGTHAPHLERIVIRVIPEYATRLLELQRGELDVMQGIQMEDLPRLQREHPEIRLHSRGLRKTDFVVWNLRDERFADVRVRRALAHAVDVDTLIEALLTVGPERYGRRAVGTIPPVLCEQHHDGIEPLAHDRDRAAALLAEAGWRDTDGDGFVDRDGQRLGFTLLTNAGNARREQAQVILQQQLAAAGVDVRLETIDSNAFRQRLRDGEFDAALWGLFASLFVDPSNRWHSGEAQDNWGGYANPEVDALIERGLATTDAAEATRCWHELQEVVYADQPYLFLYWRTDVVGVQRRVQGATPDVLGLFSGIEDWWIPASEQRRAAAPGGATR